MPEYVRYLNIRSATVPIMAPDGDRVAFLSDITGNFQVWSIGLSDHAASRWPVQLTFFADKVWELYGTPAADHLLAVSDSGGNERQQFYLISGFGNGPFDVRRVTENEDAIHTFGAWSNDGQEIVYTSNARNLVDFDIYRLDLRTGAATLLRQCQGRRSVTAWTPDRRYVYSMDTVATEQVELFVLDLETGVERHLTADQKHARYGEISWAGGRVLLLSDRYHDRGALCVLSPGSTEIEPLLTAGALDELAPAVAGGEMDLLTVTVDGAKAVLATNVEGISQLLIVDLTDLASPAVRHVPNLPQGVVTHISASGDGHSVVFDVQSPQRPPDVWRLDLTTAATEQITFSNYAGIDPATFVAPELVHYRTFDERQIPALFYRPQTEMPDKGYPCILYVHGGPASQQRPDFDVRFQFFLQKGYALLATNVRGSTGYGRQYMMLDDLERRMDSVADLRFAVNWLQTKDIVDESRIAIYGRSYGGFMVLAALTEYPELFAAGVDVVGIADWESFLERTSPWRRAHREREYGSLAGHREFLRAISPIHKAERIRAPLLVLAGDNDPRVPLYESEQIVQRVQAQGGQVKFIHYADEGHRFSKLSNRIDSFTQMAAFLEAHL